jgi:DNA mismatch endonuclease (patch repair protein)
MSRIRSKNTKPELIVRSMFHQLGYRFTVNGPKNKKLPGKPDIVLPKHKTVVFAHGCFWHAHENCKDFRLPKTRTEWWKAKLEGNAARDARQQDALKKLGWKVVVIWACELKNQQALEARLPALVEG